MDGLPNGRFTKLYSTATTTTTYTTTATTTTATTRVKFGKLSVW